MMPGPKPRRNARAHLFTRGRGLSLLLVPASTLWLAHAGCSAGTAGTGSSGVGGGATTVGAGGKGSTTAATTSTGQAGASTSATTATSSTSGQGGQAGAGGQGGPGGHGGAAGQAGAGGQAGIGGQAGAGGQTGAGGHAGAAGQGGVGGHGGQGGNGPVCDAGCPPLGLTFNGLDYTTQYGNAAGGQPYEDACPAGQVVIGYQGYLHPNGYHGQLQAQCGSPSLQGAGPFTISIAVGALTPLEGAVGDGTLWTLACPANQVVVGFSGRSGSLLDFLSPDCAPLTITGAPGSYVVALGAVTALGGVGDQGGSAFPDTPCPAGEVATENHLRAGDGIDDFGIGCSTPALTY